LPREKHPDPPFITSKITSLFPLHPPPKVENRSARLVVLAQCLGTLVLVKRLRTQAVKYIV